MEEIKIQKKNPIVFIKVRKYVAEIDVKRHYETNIVVTLD